MRVEGLTASLCEFYLSKEALSAIHYRALPAMDEALEVAVVTAPEGGFIYHLAGKGKRGRQTMPSERRGKYSTHQGFGVIVPEYDQGSDILEVSRVGEEINFQQKRQYLRLRIFAVEQ